jgi:hypothetical protein
MIWTLSIGLFLAMMRQPALPDEGVVAAEDLLDRVARRVTETTFAERDAALYRLRESLSCVIRLEARGRAVPIADVQPCQEPSGDGLMYCDLFYLDDMEHTAARLGQVPTCRPSDALRLVLRPAYGKPRLYAVNAGASRSGQRPRPREVSVRSDGTLDLRRVPPTYDLFFTMIKGPGERYVKKVIWALTRGVPPAAERRSARDARIAAVEWELDRACRDLWGATSEEEDAALAKLRSILERSIRLEAGGRVVPIAAVYPCDRLEGDSSCNLVYRDETHHAAEGLDEFPTCASTDALRLVLPPRYRGAMVWAADGAAMHSEPQPRPREVPVRPDGTLDVARLPPSYDLLFTIIKAPGERFLKKIVWALRRQIPSAPEVRR